MSDEVRPKRHRRRLKKSRKKKVTETIESIIPGRAPLGVSNLLQQIESKKTSTPLDLREEEESEKHNLV
ncbi:hypothetical protein FE257_012026 [Aspergillus nanangensis]|uniref:Uncharacterized protein n=1 Tax=Aspergillus nanangensis TaxID=2582783 RepID=A0AAD4GR22_ASPNN|nr:hypothetical protein FE257_012026 [Aspergillus nanangensis]